MKKNESNYENSKSLFVLKIVTLSFAILACVVLATVMLTRWISDISRAVKESKTKLAKAAARLNKFRKERIKHILKLRRIQLKEEKESEKYNKKHGTDEDDEVLCECENEESLEDFDDGLDNIEVDEL